MHAETYIQICSNSRFVVNGAFSSFVSRLFFNALTSFSECFGVWVTLDFGNTDIDRFCISKVYCGSSFHAFFVLVFKFYVTTLSFQ